MEVACSATLNGEMYIFGGRNRNRKVNWRLKSIFGNKIWLEIAKVTDCAVTTDGELPFDYLGGACNTFPFGIMLCFSRHGLLSGSTQSIRECHSWVNSKTNIWLQNHFSRFNGSTFQTEAKSNFPHSLVGTLGSYRDSPFITGGYTSSSWPAPFSTSGLKTEVLNYDTSTWVQADDYPFSTGDDNMYVYITYCVYIQKSMYIKYIIYIVNEL